MHPRCFALGAAFVLAALSAALPSSASDYHGVRVIAHRGAGFDFDENTVEACRQSYDRGIRGYEVDIRRTRDNQLVLMHDSDVSRTTGGTGKIEEMALSEVTQLRTLKHQVPVPAAADLFHYFKGKSDVYLMLEMKTTDTKAYPDSSIESYCRLLHESASRTLSPGTYCFISFDQRALAAMHRVDPHAFTGYLTSAPPTDELIEQARKLGCKRISVPIETTPRKFARKIKEAGFELSLWPIRAVEDADLAVAWGASIICTDTPGLLLGQKELP